MHLYQDYLLQGRVDFPQKVGREGVMNVIEVSH